MVLKGCRKYNLVFFFLPITFGIGGKAVKNCLVGTGICLFCSLVGAALLWPEKPEVIPKATQAWQKEREDPEWYPQKHCHWSKWLCPAWFPNHIRPSSSSFFPPHHLFSCQNNQAEIFLISSLGAGLSLIKTVSVKNPTRDRISFSLLGLIWFPLLLLYGMHTGELLWWVVFGPNVPRLSLLHVLYRIDYIAYVLPSISFQISLNVRMQWVKILWPLVTIMSLWHMATQPSCGPFDCLLGNWLSDAS